MKTRLLIIVVGLIILSSVIFVISFSNTGLLVEENSLVLSSGEKIAYSIKNGKIQSMDFVEDSNSLFISLLPSDNGSMKVTVPLNFFYKYHKPDNVFFMVLFEGEEQHYEITDTENTKTISFDFHKGIDMVEITGVIIR